jgi:membrane AbrB-like protein
MSAVPSNPWLPDTQRLRRVGLAIVLAVVAALVCQALRTPIPWMIGPLLSTAVASVLGAPLASSRRLRDVGQWLIGTVLGLYFTPQVVALVLSHAAAIVLGIVWALLLGLAFGAFLRRANPQAGVATRLRIDPATVFFASAIGGASEMSLLAERRGARVDLVVAAHSTRVLLVVLLIPFGFQWAGIQGLDATLTPTQDVRPLALVLLLALTLAGSLVMAAWRRPNPWMLGALAVAFALTAAGVELSAPPRPLTNAAQLLIAISLGTRFTPQFIRAAPHWVATVALGTLVMIAACAGFAWLLAWGTGLHSATLLLGTSPGGIAEMCITAKVLQLGVPIVTAFHVTRLAAVLLLADRLYGWTVRAPPGATGSTSRPPPH